MSLSDKGIVTFRGGLGGKKLFRFEAKDVKKFIKETEIDIKNPTITMEDMLERFRKRAGEFLR